MAAIVKIELGQGVVTEVISTGAWYAVESIIYSETQTSPPGAYISLDDELVDYIAASEGFATSYSRAITPYLYFPSGFRFYARATNGQRRNLLKVSTLL